MKKNSKPNGHPNGKGAAKAAPEYSIREGAHVGKKAQKLIPIMKRLAAEGRGTSEELVRECQSPKSPGHDCFEWDDTLASQRWRIHQAAGYWSSLRVLIEKPDGDSVKAPAFVSVRVNKQQRFVDVEDAAENPDWREQMLEQAKQELASFKRRYDALRSVAGMKPLFSAIETALTAKVMSGSKRRPATAA